MLEVVNGCGLKYAYEAYALLMSNVCIHACILHDKIYLVTHALPDYRPFQHL